MSEPGRLDYDFRVGVENLDLTSKEPISKRKFLKRSFASVAGAGIGITSYYISQKFGLFNPKTLTPPCDTSVFSINDDGLQTCLSYLQERRAKELVQGFQTNLSKDDLKINADNAFAIKNQMQDTQVTSDETVDSNLAEQEKELKEFKPFENTDELQLLTKGSVGHIIFHNGGSVFHAREGTWAYYNTDENGKNMLIYVKGIRKKDGQMSLTLRKALENEIKMTKTAYKLFFEKQGQILTEAELDDMIKIVEDDEKFVYIQPSLGMPMNSLVGVDSEKTLGSYFGQGLEQHFEIAKNLGVISGDFNIPNFVIPIKGNSIAVIDFSISYAFNETGTNLPHTYNPGVFVENLNKAFNSFSKAASLKGKDDYYANRLAAEVVSYVEKSKLIPEAYKRQARTAYNIWAKNKKLPLLLPNS